MRMLRIAITLAAGCVGAASMPTPMATAESSAATTDCRARFEGTWPDGGRFSGQVRPYDVRPHGRGVVHVVDADGTQLVMHATNWLCRRDGGTVPDHGGANIADSQDGRGTLRPKNGVAIPVTVSFHIEDRGDGARNREDYFAIRAVNAAGDEVYFNANYLASGSVDIIPVTLPPQ